MFAISDSFKSILSSSGLNFTFRIFGLGSSFLTTLIITNLFGLATFGNYTSVFTVAQIFAMFFALGIPGTLIKIIGNERLNEHQSQRLLLTGLKVAGVIALVPVCILAFGSEILAGLYENNTLKHYFLLAGIFMPVFIVHEILLCYFLARTNYLKYNLFIFVVPNVLFVVLLLLSSFLNLTQEYSYLSYALALLITVLAESFIIFNFKPNMEPVLIGVPKLLKAARPLLFSGLMLYSLNWTSTIMLGLMLDEKQVGIYNIAYRIGSFGFLVIVSVSTIITPRIAEFYGENNMVELKKLINNSTRLIALLSLPLTLVLIVFADTILSFFGTEAIMGNFALAIIAVGVLISASAGNVDQILNMTNNHIILQNISIASFLFNIVANYLLIPKFGIEGSATANLLTNILMNLLCVYYIKKKLGFYTLT